MGIGHLQVLEKKQIQLFITWSRWDFIISPVIFQTSIQKSLYQHLKLAFGQGKKIKMQREETNCRQVGVAALFPVQN